MAIEQLAEDAWDTDEEEKTLRIDRENRVKFLQNIGKYITDNAENLIPQEGHGSRASAQKIIISMNVDEPRPHVTVSSDYIPFETLFGVDWRAE